MAVSRLHKEMREMASNPPPLCTAGMAGEDPFLWNATIRGPLDTPYENGLFRLEIRFPTDYPFRAPTAVFKAKIFHPNIKPEGTICADFLSGRWSPAMNVNKLLLSLCSLLCDPNSDSPLNGEAAELYKDDRAKYIARAKSWTASYAK